MNRRVAFSAVLAGLIFAFDLALPLGVAGGVPYVALVLTGLWYPDKRSILVLGLIGSILTLVGYFLSEPGGVPWIVFTNRALALAAIWATAILGFQRKQREEEEREEKSNARLRSAIDILQEAFAYFDAADRLVICNDKFRRLIPVPDHALQPGIPYEDILQSIVEAGKVADALGREEEFIRQRIERHRDPQGPFLRELTNGTWYMVNEIRTPDGGICMTMTNVTELKVTETKLRETEFLFKAVVDNSPSFISLKDMDGRFQLVNRKHVEMFSPELTSVLGKTSHGFLSEKQATEDTTQDRKVVETKSANTEERQVATTQGTLDFLIAKFPISDEGGAIKGIGTIGTDITERKRAEEKLRKAHDNLNEQVQERTLQLRDEIEERKKIEEDLIQANEQCKLANQAKSSFLASMSHELRTPLNAIIGFSDLIRHKVLGPDGTDRYTTYADDIHQSGEHLLELINEILDLSTIEAGKLQLKEDTVNVAELIDLSLHMVKPRADEKKVRISYASDSSLPFLRADELRVKQILLNLLSNAIKFTPKDGSIKVNSQIEEDGRLSIAIADTGIGMDQEGIARAMSMFERTDSTVIRNNEGTGLGLPLSKGLIETHGGTLDIESSPGKGTTVTVCFPADRVIADPATVEGQPGVIPAEQKLQ